MSLKRYLALFLFFNIWSRKVLEVACNIIAITYASFQGLLSSIIPLILLRWGPAWAWFPGSKWDGSGSGPRRPATSKGRLCHSKSRPVMSNEICWDEFDKESKEVKPWGEPGTCQTFDGWEMCAFHLATWDQLNGRVTISAETWRQLMPYFILVNELNGRILCRIRSTLYRSLFIQWVHCVVVCECFCFDVTVCSIRNSITRSWCSFFRLTFRLLSWQKENMRMNEERVK